MAQRAFDFTVSTLYNLLVHNSDGECPLNGEVQDVLRHPQLERMVALVVASDEWTTPEMLQIRFDARRRTASWTKGQEGMEWAERNDTPQVRS